MGSEDREPEGDLVGFEPDSAALVHSGRGVVTLVLGGRADERPPSVSYPSRGGGLEGGRWCLLVRDDPAGGVVPCSTTSLSGGRWASKVGVLADGAASGGEVGLGEGVEGCALSMAARRRRGRDGVIPQPPVHEGPGRCRDGGGLGLPDPGEGCPVRRRHTDSAGVVMPRACLYGGSARGRIYRESIKMLHPCIRRLGGHATTRREHGRRESWRHFCGQRARRITNRLLMGASTGGDEVN